MYRKILAAFAALVASTVVVAQDYPNRTISIVVPFAAGGPTDTVARLVAKSMTGTLGQTVIVENVAGAGGTIGPKKVAAAKPDGYTLVLMHIGISTSVSLYRNLGYNPVTDLEPIGLITDVPMTFIARKDFPPKDMKELIAYVKANKDKVTYANAGVGAASHLCGMLLMSAIQADLTTVPYKGTGPAMTDLIGGQVDFMCDQTTNTTPQIKRRQGQGLFGDHERPHQDHARSADGAGVRHPGLPGRHLARPVGPEGNAEAGDRQADERAAEGAPGSVRGLQVRRSRHGTGAAGPGNSRCAGQAPQGGSGQVGADHQEGRRVRRLNGSRCTKDEARRSAGFFSCAIRERKKNPPGLPAGKNRSRRRNCRHAMTRTDIAYAAWIVPARHDS